MQPQDTLLVAPVQNCLARALYDNVAESPDELAFRKGDVLVVLEQNTYGLEGWWLCTLRGRQGICPGNRLRLLAGLYTSEATTVAAEHELGSLQRQGKRRSWHVQPNKVVTPKKYNDVYLYDMPASRCSPVQSIPESLCPQDDLGESYDVPPRAIPVGQDAEPRRNWLRCTQAQSCRELDSYDVPRPLLPGQQQLTPSSSASSLTADSLSSSNRSSVANVPSDYDVPKALTAAAAAATIATTATSTSNSPQLQQLYDVPGQQLRELPLELSSALDSLARMQSESTAAISRLLGYVTPHWRRRDRLEPRLMDIRLTVVRLRTSVHDLAEFGEGALGNAARAPDKGLAVKLRPLVMALRNADRLVQNAARDLDEQKWSVDVLCTRDDPIGRLPDALEQLVACSRALTEDVRQIASFIQGNSILLFKRAAVSVQVSADDNDNLDDDNGNSAAEEWTDDYDYVNLESKETTQKKHAEIRDAMPSELRKGYDALVKDAESAAMDGSSVIAGCGTAGAGDDGPVLRFYAAQAATHHGHLTHAIDAFLQTVEHSQPPRVFLAHGKFVVLSAHRLVHIGDAAHRDSRTPQVRQRLLAAADALSEALATSVAKTRQAALHFPSVAAVQQMVDSVVDISHLARDLKLSLLQAAAECA